MSLSRIVCAPMQVNRRLQDQEKDGKDGDPAFPKHQWPSSELCHLPSSKVNTANGMCVLRDVPSDKVMTACEVCEMVTAWQGQLLSWLAAPILVKHTLTSNPLGVEPAGTVCPQACRAM